MLTLVHSTKATPWWPFLMPCGYPAGLCMLSQSIFVWLKHPAPFCMLLSVVIPVYNSESSIGNLVALLQQSLPATNVEIVLVNDGSRDRSERIIFQLAQQYSNVQAISLRRNFGEFNAVMCGLNHCTGDYAAIIDDDFQNPPAEMLKLVEKARQDDLDVVYASYGKKEHSLFRNLGSKLFNWLISQLMDKPKNLYLSSFKVISRPVIDEIVRYKGPYPFIDGLIFAVTRNVDSQLVDHQKRKEGKSNYSIRRLVSLFLNMFIICSPRPLRILFMSGWLFIALGLLAVVFETVIIWFFEEYYKAEHIVWITLVLVMGLQFFAMGLLGEYLGKIMMTQNGWPQYVVKQKSIKDDRKEA
jgi:glycosyltransferase involved in cell wall biosynthesis